LYAIENEIRGRSPDERRQIPQAHARPLLEAMREWLEAALAKLSRKPETAVAIGLMRSDAGVRSCAMRTTDT
jgi:hypothetical protein